MSEPIAAGAIVYAKDIACLARFYAEVAGLEVMHEVGDHIVLESEALELVIVAIPRSTAARIEIASPPARREHTAFKLVFVVESLAAARAAAAAAGGGLNPPDQEWDFQGARLRRLRSRGQRRPVPGLCASLRRHRPAPRAPGEAASPRPS